MKKVVIIDDHPLFRAGVKDFLDKGGEFEVIFEGSSREQLQGFLSKTKVGLDTLLFVLDISLPDCSGFELISLIERSGGKASRCIMLSMHGEVEYADHALELGAFGYVTKSNDTAILIECLESVDNGNTYISRDLTLSQTPTRNHGDFPENDESLDKLGSLTKRERAVLKLVAKEQTSREISEILFLSPRTVENHRARICAKLDVTGSHGLIAFAVKNRTVIEKLE